LGRRAAACMTWCVRSSCRVKQGHWFKTWKRRFGYLHAESGVLEWYVDDKMSSSKGKCVVGADTVLEVLPSRHKGVDAFSMKGKGGNLVARGEDNDATKKWVAVLREYIASKQ